jgi:hypothetical protein
MSRVLTWPKWTAQSNLLIEVSAAGRVQEEAVAIGKEGRRWKTGNETGRRPVAAEIICVK